MDCVTKREVKNYRKPALPLIFALFFIVCAESDEVIRLKLDIILKDDMEAILDGVAAEALLETPYFDILEYKKFDDGPFSRLVVADFYFLRPMACGSIVKITRKYRYLRNAGLWDRYYNRYYVVRGGKNETED
ncbi:MAG: hypothetical protein LBU70_09655 [Chitinispirillales bacterium]|jgi:hypothetical protein|nr:hypothetical protein [Chitinispirillales bacterium]